MYRSHLSSFGLIAAALTLALAPALSGCDTLGPDFDEPDALAAGPVTSGATGDGEASYDAARIGIDHLGSVSDEGVVVGWNGSCCGGEAVAWSPGVGLQTLPYPAGMDRCLARDINAHGDIVGHCAPDGGLPVPVLWASGSNPVILDFSDRPWAEAASINDEGVIVGRKRTVINGHDCIAPVVWANAGSSPVVLPHIDEDNAERLSGLAMWISNSGFILGENNTQDDDGEMTDSRLVIWTDWTADAAPVELDHWYELRLAHLSPLQLRHTKSVNEHGDVAAITGNSDHRFAAVWLHDGNGTWNGPIAFDSKALANHVGIGERLDGLVNIVGRHADTEATRWTFDITTQAVDRVTDLPLPGGLHHARGLTSAYMINGEGWIVGSSDQRGGNSPGYEVTLWQPTDPDGDGNGNGNGDGDGGSDEGPTASFTYSCGNSPECSFTDASEGDIEQHAWASTAGHQSADPNPTFDFSAAGPGTYTVTLTVQDADGQSDEAQESIRCRDHRVHGLRCS